MFAELQLSQIFTFFFLCSVLIGRRCWSPQEALENVDILLVCARVYAFLEFSVILCVNVPPQTALVPLYLHH